MGHASYFKVEVAARIDAIKEVRIETDGTDAKRRMLRKRRDNTREGLER